MQKQNCKYTYEHEKILAEAVRVVASELRLIEAADLIAYLHNGQHGNVRSLVNASTEMYFKPGTVSFGLSGDVCVSWDSPPRFTLDMQFRHRKIDVYFRLMLEHQEAGVEIDYISFGRNNLTPEEAAHRFAEALADARIPTMSAMANMQGGDTETLTQYA